MFVSDGACGERAIYHQYNAHFRQFSSAQYMYVPVLLPALPHFRPTALPPYHFTARCALPLCWLALQTNLTQIPYYVSKYIMTIAV